MGAMIMQVCKVQEVAAVIEEAARDAPTQQVQQ
jgi:hypothetical protein